MNATANPPQILYQPHTATKIQKISLHIGPSASSLSSSSVSTLNPLNSLPVNANKYTVLFVAGNKSVQTFIGLDNQ